MRSAPSLESFPQGCLSDGLNVCLIDDDFFLIKERSSGASFFCTFLNLCSRQLMM